MSGEEKFNSCRFRSHDKVPMGTVACCGNQVKEGYLCWHNRVNLEDISATICEKCVYYISKYEPNNKP